MLKDQLLADDVRARVVRETSDLIEDQVSTKRGISGMAIKTGYGAIKKIKASLVTEVVDGLLDQFVARLEPFYTDWDGSGRAGSFGAFITGKQGPVANALLGVTDAQADRASNRALRKLYGKLRPQAEKHVVEAVPGLGHLVDRYINSAPQ